MDETSEYETSQIKVSNKKHLNIVKNLLETQESKHLTSRRSEKREKDKCWGFVYS